MASASGAEQKQHGGDIIPHGVRKLHKTHAILRFDVTRHAGRHSQTGFSSAAVMTVAGLGAGAALALVSTRLLGSLLVGVTPGDPLTFAGVTGILAGAAVGASVLAGAARYQNQCRGGAALSGLIGATRSRCIRAFCCGNDFGGAQATVRVG